jgi:hypothetical protein
MTICRVLNKGACLVMCTDGVFRQWGCCYDEGSICAPAIPRYTTFRKLVISLIGSQGFCAVQKWRIGGAWHLKSMSRQPVSRLQHLVFPNKPCRDFKLLRETKVMEYYGSLRWSSEDHTACRRKQACPFVKVDYLQLGFCALENGMLLSTWQSMPRSPRVNVCSYEAWTEIGQ